MNRRHFLQSTAAGLALSTVSYAAVPAATKPRRVALIGCGWYGKNDVCRLIQVDPVEVVALCDVDSQMLAQAADLVSERQASHAKPQTYGDYRKLLADQELDIVLVGTPDHWHALPMIAAVEAGADVYVQKPISVDIREGQAMLAAAREHDRVVQVGTQRRSTPHLADAKKQIIAEDKLGKIGLVEICCYYHMRARGNPPDTAPPETLDYEMWTGPAPMRPYNELVHPRSWRAFMEYGNGIIGDMCIHMLDMVRWMLDLGWPDHVSSSGGIYVQKESKANITDTQTATFDFGDLPVVWQHRSWGDAPDPEYPWAAFLYGDKGTLKASVNKWEFFPAGKKEPSESGTVLYEREEYPEDLTEDRMELHVASANRAHQRDFLAAVDARTKPVADIEQGYISTTSCILANLSMKLGRSLAWDAQAGNVAGDDEANGLLARPYRAPWEHPAS